MGIVVQEVTFDGPAPGVEAIVARLTELVGLPVKCHNRRRVWA
jgi:hypothetical protein